MIVNDSYIHHHNHHSDQAPLSGICYKECRIIQFPMPGFDRLVQERRSSSVLAMELRLSYTNPSVWDHD